MFRLLEDIIIYRTKELDDKRTIVSLYQNDLHFKFNSNMVSDSDLFYGFYSLLTVDHNVVLPYNIFLRFLITSNDVIHSWAIPSLGVKLDACPGRLAQTMIYIKREGFFYGQCSEICGVNHSFMPIVIEAVDPESFFDWLNHPTPSYSYGTLS